MNKLIIRNILYSVILLCIIIVIILIRTQTPFGRDNTSFTPPAGTEITKIELTAGKEKLLLERSGEKWIVNGNQEARRSAVGFITEIITGMRIKSPVSPEMYEEQISGHNVDEVKVRAFSKKKLVTSFIVYKTTSNAYGNMMKLSQRSKPYIMHLPGIEGNIGAVFTLNELYWQPFTIFNALPSELSSVTLENMSDSTSSFSIRYDGVRYVLTDTKTSLAGWDTSRVRRYITYFTHIPFENWASDLSPEAVTLITSKKPAYRLTIKKQDGSKVTLTLWKRFKNDDTPDEDRMWARSGENQQLLVVRYFDIDPVLKKKSYFFQQ